MYFTRSERLPVQNLEEFATQHELLRLDDSEKWLWAGPQVLKSLVPKYSGSGLLPRAAPVAHRYII